MNCDHSGLVQRQGKRRFPRDFREAVSHVIGIEVAGAYISRLAVDRDGQHAAGIARP